MNEGVQNISNKNTEEENNIPIEEKKSITQNVHKYKKNHETNKNSSRLDNIKPKFPLKNTQTFKPNKIEVENIKTDNESKSRPISANRHNMNVTIYSLKTGLNNKSRDENNGETDNNINNTDPNYRHKMNRKNSSSKIIDNWSIKFNFILIKIS